MSQDECSTEARRYTQGKTNKEGTTRSGATAPTERDKAPARQQSTTQREQDKISILRGSQNIPP